MVCKPSWTCSWAGGPPCLRIQSLFSLESFGFSSHLVLCLLNFTWALGIFGVGRQTGRLHHQLHAPGNCDHDDDGDDDDNCDDYYKSTPPFPWCWWQWPWYDNRVELLVRMVTSQPHLSLDGVPGDLQLLFLGKHNHLRHCLIPFFAS